MTIQGQLRLDFHKNQVLLYPIMGASGVERVLDGAGRAKKGTVSCRTLEWALSPQKGRGVKRMNIYIRTLISCSTGYHPSESSCQSELGPFIPQHFRFRFHFYRPLPLFLFYNFNQLQAGLFFYTEVVMPENVSFLKTPSILSLAYFVS